MTNVLIAIFALCYVSLWQLNKKTTNDKKWMLLCMSLAVLVVAQVVPYYLLGRTVSFTAMNIVLLLVWNFAGILFGWLIGKSVRIRRNGEQIAWSGASRSMSLWLAAAISGLTAQGGLSYFSSNLGPLLNASLLLFFMVVVVVQNYTILRRGEDFKLVESH